MSEKSKSAKRELFPTKTDNSNSEAESNGNETDSSNSEAESNGDETDSSKSEAESNGDETDSSNSEAESNGNETDSRSEIEAPTEDSHTDALTLELESLQIEGEKKDGEWLKNHKWEKEKPDSTLEMEATVSNSGSYPTPRKWTKNRGAFVDLAKIYSNLPSYVEDVMKGGINSCRQELERVLQTPLSELALDTPHVFEIKNESVPSKDQKVPQQEKYTASSLISQPKDPEVKIFYYFDCEHMLKMYVPGKKLSWFQTKTKKHTKWIKKIKNDHYMRRRWVFTPSFRRAKIALLQWPVDEVMDDYSTIRILVVRPSEFDAYVTYCGPHFPVIRLPQDEIGAGYTRYWIQKIALRLELQFIWMIDDSIKYFVEYDPVKQPPTGSYKEFRKLKFGLVFERIEKFVKETADEEIPIVAMSPRRFNGRNLSLQEPFVCKPPQGVVYLNLRKLQEKHVYYRPELKTLEDMLFGYECEQRNLKVFRDNRIHLYDQQWKDTGASSPSVKTNTQRSKKKNTRKKFICQQTNTRKKTICQQTNSPK